MKFLIFCSFDILHPYYKCWLNKSPLNKGGRMFENRVKNTEKTARLIWPKPYSPTSVHDVISTYYLLLAIHKSELYF